MRGTIREAGIGLIDLYPLTRTLSPQAGEVNRVRPRADSINGLTLVGIAGEALQGG